MTHDEKQIWVRDQRENAASAGCKSCGKASKWLVLKGRPSVGQMVRMGRSHDTLLNAIVSRGWYCRSCVGTGKADAGTSRAAEDNQQRQSVLPSPPPPDHTKAIQELWPNAE